ncbi:MAG: hypothetical protein U0797_11270 [Gemmataceae bacterium]
MRWLSTLAVACALALACGGAAQAQLPVSGTDLQTRKQLRIANATGFPLTVFLRVTGDSTVYRFDVPIGGVGHLRVNGVRVLASEVNLWAEGGGRIWTKFRYTPLVMVSAPYVALTPKTFTFTFHTP